MQWLHILGNTWKLSNPYYKRFFDKQVPKEWKLDPDWEAESKEPRQFSHLNKFPSKWSAAATHQDPLHTVKIVDQFVIQRTDKSDIGSINGSVNQWPVLLNCNINVILTRGGSNGKKKKKNQKKGKKKNLMLYFLRFYFSAVRCLYIGC